MLWLFYIDGEEDKERWQKLCMGQSGLGYARVTKDPSSQWLNN